MQGKLATDFSKSCISFVCINAFMGFVDDK